MFTTNAPAVIRYNALQFASGIELVFASCKIFLPDEQTYVGISMLLYKNFTDDYFFKDSKSIQEVGLDSFKRISWMTMKYIISSFEKEEYLKDEATSQLYESEFNRQFNKIVEQLVA